MAITAILGVAIGYFTYEIIFNVNPIEPKATVSWCLAFFIGVARQHALHRWLTFVHKPPYWKSLFRAYAMYSMSFALGSCLNWIFVERLLLNHRMAWFLCLFVTTAISFFLLKKYVFKQPTHPVINT
jgi:putative flippase GtrA